MLKEITLIEGKIKKLSKESGLRVDLDNDKVSAA